MNTSSRFIVGTHILAGLYVVRERCGIEAATSDFLAESVNTNPVVIRRILGQLRDAGLVESQVGSRGGFRLARPAASITLLDIYQAVEDGSLFHFHYSEPNQQCPIGCTIQDTLKGVCSEAENAVEAILGNKTILELVQEMMATKQFEELASAAEAEGRTPTR